MCLSLCHAEVGRWCLAGDAPCKLRAGRCGEAGLCSRGVLGTTEQGTLLALYYTGVWGLTSSDLLGMGANIVLGRKIALQERQAEG